MVPPSQRQYVEVQVLDLDRFESPRAGLIGPPEYVEATQRPQEQSMMLTGSCPDQ